MAAKIRLTDATVGRLKPRLREYTVWDTRMAGLGVRVRTSGYRCFVYHHVQNGCSRRHTVGPVALMSCEEARDRCLDFRIKARAHKSTAGTVRERAPSLKEFVAGEWKQDCYDGYKPSTRKSTRSALRSQLLSTFGLLPLDRITRTDVIRWFDAYSQTAPGGANWTLDLLQQILNHAMARGHVRTNPARGIKRNPRPRMTRFLSRDEIRRLHEVLSRCVAERPSYRQQADIIRLLLLTGCRKGEIVNLQWKEVSGDVLDLTDSKTGPRRVFLNAEARGIIESQPRNGNDYVFPSSANGAKPLSPNLRLWHTARKRAGMEDVRLHDLRHTVASIAAMKGVPLPVVARLLGHRQVRMTLRYAHVGDREVEAAAERIGRAITSICNLSGA